MQSNQQIRIIWHTVRLTQEEYQTLKNFATASVSSSLSDYSRRVLLQQPVNVLSRNQSLDDFLADMLLVRKDLRQIGNLFNQSVRRLQTLTTQKDLQHWLLINEQDKNRLFELIENISVQLNALHRLWSQS